MFVWPDEPGSETCFAHPKASPFSNFSDNATEERPSSYCYRVFIVLFRFGILVVVVVCYCVIWYLFCCLKV